MTVIVYNGSKPTRYDAISAIRVGPVQRDLVLIRAPFDEIRIPPDQWTRFETHQDDLPPEPVPEHRPRRAIRLPTSSPVQKT